MLGVRVGLVAPGGRGAEGSKTRLGNAYRERRETSHRACCWISRHGSALSVFL